MLFAHSVRRSLPAFSNSATRTFSTTPRAQLARMNIIGRLAAEPEAFTSPNGVELVRYAVGTSYGRQDNRQTSWFKVTSFDAVPRRDYLLALPKGTLLHLEADAKMRKFEDKNGNPQVRLELTQKNFEVLSRPHPPEEESASSTEAE